MKFDLKLIEEKLKDGYYVNLKMTYSVLQNGKSKTNSATFYLEKSLDDDGAIKIDVPGDRINEVNSLLKKYGQRGIDSMF